MLLLQGLSVALIIGSLQSCLRRIEKIVRKQISSEIIKIRNSLRRGKGIQRRRVRIDTREHLLSVPQFAALVNGLANRSRPNKRNLRNHIRETKASDRG